MPKEECQITEITTKEPVKARKTNAGILCRCSLILHIKFFENGTLDRRAI